MEAYLVFLYARGFRASEKVGELFVWLISFKMIELISVIELAFEKCVKIRWLKIFSSSTTLRETFR